MRPIDGDALFKKVKTECNPYGKPTIGFEDGNKVMNWIEQAPTIGGWVSVKSRMPEPPAQCLVYSDKSYRPRGMETATYTNMGWMTATYFPEITHWMLLPEAPEPPNGGDAE